jgi:hypothetical protein
MRTGFVSEPPSAGSRLKIRAPVPPAHASRLAEPRMIPMSWQVCIESTTLITLALAGSSSGTSMISKKSHVPPADELL